MAEKAAGNISRSIGLGLRWFARGVNHLLWPGVCESCGREADDGDGGLCRQCWQGLMACVAGDYCPACGRDASLYAMIGGHCGDCAGRTILWDGIARGGVYQGPLREMILALKFRDRTETANRLAGLLDAAVAARPFATEVDYVVPVPLHWRRRLWRGYNHAAVLVHSMRSRPGPISTDLVRVRHTPHQWNLSAAARRRNVKGAFAVRRGHDFSGRTVCVVDDITTSGATLNECALTLKEAGAARVYALVVATANQDTD